MSYRATLERSIEDIRGKEGSLGSAPNEELKQLVDASASEIIGRHIVLSGTCGVDVSISGNKWQQLRPFTTRQTFIYGTFQGFVDTSRVDLIAETGDKVQGANIGILVRDDHDESEFSIMPLFYVQEAFDTKEYLAGNEDAEQIDELFSADELDLYRLAEVVRDMKLDQEIADEQIAIMKAHIGSLALPVDVCTSVYATKFYRSGDFRILFSPTMQSVSDKDRFSILGHLVGPDDYMLPTLCLETQSGPDQYTVTHLTTFPASFGGLKGFSYTKPPKSTG